MPIPPAEFHPYSYPKRRAKDCGAPVDVPTDRETQLKRDLRALERVQAARPMKPPTRTGRP